MINVNQHKECPTWAKWALFILFLIALFFRHNISIMAIFAPHDDGLFFRGLEHLLSGNWLGPYDQLTLAKGPMLSLFASMTAALGIPFKTFEFFLYLLVCILFSVLAFRLTRSVGFMLLLFTLLAFNSVFWNINMLRFMREPVYLSLSMAVVGGLVWALWLSEARQRLFVAGGLGLLLGMFWLTREESVWLYPTLSVLLVFALFRPQANHSYLMALRKNSSSIMIVVLGAGLGFVTVLLPVLLLNQQYYGKFITNEFRSAEFREAIGALMRIDAPSASPYVPVSPAALKLAYAVSPAANELRPHLNIGWAVHGKNLPGVIEGEIAGGWFVWAVRDAVAMAGHHPNAATAAAFYRRLGEEVNQACSKGQIPCNAQRDTLAPYFPWKHLGEFLDSVKRGLWIIISLETGNINPVWSHGSENQLALWERHLGQVAPLHPKNNIMKEQVVVSGWLAHPHKIPTLSWQTVDSNSYRFELFLKDAPDVISSFAEGGQTDIVAHRFEFTTDCLNEQCILLGLAGDEVTVIGNMSGLQQGRLVFKDNLFRMHIDFIGKQSKSIDVPVRPFLETWKFSVIHSYGKIANKIFPVLWVLATLGLILYASTRRRKEGNESLDILFILTLAALTAVFIRAALIAYIDVTSWKAVNDFYLSSAYGFGIFYAVAGTYLFLVSLRKIYTKSIAPIVIILTIVILLFATKVIYYKESFIQAIPISELLQRAESQLTSGDIASATLLYLKHLQHSESINDLKAIIADKIILIELYEKQEQFTNALRLIEQLIQSDASTPNISYSTLEKLYRKSVVLSKYSINEAQYKENYVKLADFYLSCYLNNENCKNELEKKMHWLPNGLSWLTEQIYLKKLQLVKTVSHYEKSAIAGDYSKLGEFYFRIRYWTQTEEYFRRAIEIYAELDDKRNMITIYSALSAMYAVLAHRENL